MTHAEHKGAFTLKHRLSPISISFWGSCQLLQDPNTCSCQLLQDPNMSKNTLKRMLFITTKHRKQIQNAIYYNKTQQAKITFFLTFDVFGSCFKMLVVSFLFQFFCGLLHLHLRPGPDLSRTFDISIAPDAASVCCTSRPWFCVQAAGDAQGKNSHAQPYRLSLIHI